MVAKTFRTLAVGMVTALGFLPGCMIADEEGDEPILEESQSILAGRVLFNQATFGGNGRRCADCHPSDLIGQSGTVNPAEVQALFAANPTGPLFRGDGADTIGGNTFNRIQQHATVLIRMPLPDNVTIAGSSARTVDLPRGIPTTMNTPALDPVLMYDGRDPDLQTQDRGAILSHAGSTNVTTKQLNDIADFQKTLFSRPRLRLFANGTPLTMPVGITASQKRGRRFFLADNEFNPDLVGENKNALCGFCHSGPMLNSLSNFFVTNVDPFPHPEGFRFFTALVSEFNDLPPERGGAAARERLVQDPDLLGRQGHRALLPRQLVQDPSGPDGPLRRCHLHPVRDRPGPRDPRPG